MSNTNSTRRNCMDVLVSCLMDMTLQAQGRRALSPCSIVQRSSHRRQHTSVHVSTGVIGDTANKVRFIALLTSHLEAAGCEVHHASVDGDRLIVLTALGVADTCVASVLVGEDTYLLIMLTFLSDPEKYIKMLMPGHKINVTCTMYTPVQL